MYPIFVPSKGRSTTCTFCHNLKDTKREFYIFIYKDDYNDYIKQFKENQLVVVPETVHGITSKRQFMLDTAKTMKLGWFWMVDDDIHKFYYRPIINYNGKLTKITPSTFLSMSERFVNSLSNIPNIFQVGFKKGAFGLLQSPITSNTDIGEIHMLNADTLHGINYDLDMVALEDTDLCVQNFRKGNHNIKLNHLIFYAPKSGTGKGGLEQIYRESGKSRGVHQFKDKYNKLFKNFIRVDKKNGEKYRIHWKEFQNNELESEVSKIFTRLTF
jgi:hypothetical protein